MSDSDVSERPGHRDGLREDGSLARLTIDTVRTLAMDAVQKANSGHPGTPMALAPVGYTLWSQFLRTDPAVPDWPNRDRFVLSVGHASMLLYALLHLAKVREIDSDGKPTGKAAVSLDDIKDFRQLDSKTPGHPEYRMTTGVETTTGPLGQGCGNSVGMAIAERHLAAHFNRDGFPVFDHDIYVLCGDGDMMEGVSGEAASLAGHLKLSNLCWIYDSNTISIEGHTDLAFIEDTGKRFEAYGWNVIHVDDANDCGAVARALETFRATDDRPTFIVVHSIIGWGSPRANSEKAHGEPLGEDNVRATKKAYGWPEDAQFLVPDGVADHFHDAIAARGEPLRQEWEAMFERYRAAHPDLAAELDRARKDELPGGWDADVPVFPADAKGIASREANGKTLNAIAPHLPLLMGGAADLSPSTKTNLTFDGAGSFEANDYGGRNMHFGVREHAMGAIANGMALSYLRSYTGTFLVFADYMRAPIRLAAIMELPVIFVFTHDSIGVGEDGPTHQPIEHLATLRAIPGLDTIRPGDANEAAEAWKVALTHTHEPSVLIFSRQAIPTLDRSKYAPASGLARGAYILADAEGGHPEIILIGTGSEVPMVVAAHERLTASGIRSRVVSMPSWYLFEKQDRAYRDSVFPRSVPARLAVEQGGELGWDRYVGLDGRTITMSTFGASAPLAKLQDKYGFTVENIVAVAEQMLEKK
ncbi:transketolase [Sphingomonas alpina]|uniref:Transketolase n=1 Tax=Sphingomonas alpina TaxID=653931 RepID=A0A7H0LN79_9SPHN|nr:transketolase [Sphingomonas alpina]QNQ11132.1 transketolase [Sphingomonas alpina]